MEENFEEYFEETKTKSKGLLPVILFVAGCILLLVLVKLYIG